MSWRMLESTSDRATKSRGACSPGPTVAAEVPAGEGGVGVAVGVSVLAVGGEIGPGEPGISVGLPQAASPTEHASAATTDRVRRGMLPVNHGPAGVERGRVAFVEAGQGPAPRGPESHSWGCHHLTIG